MTEQLHDTIQPAAPSEQQGVIDIAARNIEQLEAAGEMGQHFADLYRLGMKVAPDIANVIIHPLDKKQFPMLERTGGMARHQAHGDGEHPELIINTGDGLSHYEELLRSRPISARVSAEKVGIPFEQFGAKELASFIFLHELGHTVDYMTRMTDFEESEEKRLEELDTLPVPGFDPASLHVVLKTDEGRIFMMENREAMRAEGVTNTDELMYAQEAAYHSLDSEDFPDKYAALVLRWQLDIEQQQLAA